MRTIKTKYPRSIALLLFPFDSGSVFSIGQKISNILSNQIHTVFLISSDFPADMKWPKGVVPVDLEIGRIRLDKKNGVEFFSTIKWLIWNVYIQVRMGLEILKKRDYIDDVFCAIGGYFQFPLLVAKILRKNILVFVGGEASSIAEILYGKIVFKAIKSLTTINYSLADIIIVESDSIQKRNIFRKFEYKIRNGALYFGDKNLYIRKSAVSEREEAIGFIGRMSLEKGILELMDAIPIIVAAKPRLKVYLIGSGPCDDQIAQLITNSLNENVIRLSWVENREIPTYLNKMRLLVIPSKTEGLPNILLEAISCGTPVLATPVGGIPDLIIDGQTGHFLGSLDSEVIADKIISVLNEPDELQKISESAIEKIDSTYSLDASIDRYSKIFSEIRNK